MYFDGCYFDPAYFDASVCSPAVSHGRTPPRMTGGDHRLFRAPSVTRPRPAPVTDLEDEWLLELDG